MDKENLVQTGGNSTADRAIDILLLFGQPSPTLSAVEIASRLNISRSTTYRYLQSLRNFQLLEDGEQEGMFRLGPKIFELALIARRGFGLSEVALPIMRQLAQEVDEVVLLTRRSGDQVVCIERIESSHSIRLSYERGHVLPLHAGASAKVLLAYTSHEASNGPGRGEQNPPDPKRPQAADLEKIRQQGYALSHGEVDANVRGIAAPIFLPSGDIAAGLSVAGPDFRLAAERLPDVIEAVREAAGRITELWTMIDP
jgi:DNA-binding IclR family transcriptional regulator